MTDTIPVTVESEFLRAVAEGRKAAHRGRTVPHDKVRRWLSSWGSKREGRQPRVSKERCASKSPARVGAAARSR
jgi:hypothetical protein